jgi:hypothetical protein
MKKKKIENYQICALKLINKCVFWAIKWSLRKLKVTVILNRQLYRPLNSWTKRG